MSLKFLAVGDSLAGIRSDKSPYTLRKETLLPTFESAPRFKPPEKTMVQTDWLKEPKPAAPAPEIAAAPPLERQLPSVPPKPTQVVPSKRGWFSFLRLRWFRTTKPAVDLVQSELTLEKVQPVRNDLADSDLRLVLKRKNKTKADETGALTSRARAGWSELTAKLFELGQR
jgi:hypothetical protein